MTREIKTRLDRLQAVLENKSNPSWVIVNIDGPRIWIRGGKDERELTADDLAELEKTHRVIEVHYAEKWREG